MFIFRNLCSEDDNLSDDFVEVIRQCVLIFLLERLKIIIIKKSHS